MRIRINPILIFLLVLPSLSAQEVSISALGTVRVEVDVNSHFNAVLSLPENSWTDDSGSLKLEKGKDLWLKVSLPPVIRESQMYLTESKGVRSWEIFLVKDSQLVKLVAVDWTLPYRNSMKNAAQFRGFSYGSFSQSPGYKYDAYIRIPNDSETHYNFILGTSDNFTRRQQSWSLIQGMGIGYLFMIVVLSIILILKMKYLVNWLYLILILSSGVSIIYISGLGPYLVARVLPGAAQRFWYVLLGLFSPVVILYIRTFLGESDRSKTVTVYFKILFLFTAILALVPLLIASDRVFFFVNIQSIVSFLLICAGLIRMSFIGLKPARWMLAGLLFSLVINIMGFYLSAAIAGRTMIAIIFHLISQGILTLLFGGAMILDMEEKFNRESALRENAETLAKNAVDQMSANERMADLGRLVASVTHELGTPLGVAVTLSTSLSSSSKKTFGQYEKNELSEEAFRDFLQDVQQSSELIYRNMEQARALVEGFKVVASDQVVPDIRTFSLEDYLQTLQKVLSTVIKKAGCTLEVSVEHGLTITSIPGILTQVLSNLINNALIHGIDGGKDGKIILDCTRENNRIILRVGDNGKGIPEDIQDRIFDIYFTTKKGQGGTGVGLSIVKTLVKEELKGSIHFESTPGSGTVFTVDLPENIKVN